MAKQRVGRHQRPPNPTNVGCTLLTWACCSVAWLLVVTSIHRPWVIIPAVALFGLSIVVAIGVDVRRLHDWTNEHEDE
jgi:hypothetical protein